MERYSNFSIVQFAAHPARDERLNIGIAVFHGDRIDVRISRRLERLRAISGAVDVERIRESALRLSEIDDHLRSQGMEAAAERADKLSQYGGFKLSPLGQIDSGTSFGYEDAIANLLQTLVEPEPAPVRLAKPRSSKLLTTLKKAFRQERILAQKGDTIESHRVVVDHPIVDGLKANLVLRNGAMHVFETVDATSGDTSQNKLFKDIGYSTIVLEQARMVFGEAETKTRLIYQASSAMEKLAKLGLDAAAHQGAELVNWESQDDRSKFLVTVTALAEPLPPKGKRGGHENVHASTQQKLSLN
jgi:Protein of unknown function (DUF3037)